MRATIKSDVRSVAGRRLPGDIPVNWGLGGHACCCGFRSSPRDDPAFHVDMMEPGAVRLLAPELPPIARASMR
jgi:hypothetical protein